MTTKYPFGVRENNTYSGLNPPTRNSNRQLPIKPDKPQTFKWEEYNRKGFIPKPLPTRTILIDPDASLQDTSDVSRAIAPSGLLRFFIQPVKVGNIITDAHSVLSRIVAIQANRIRIAGGQRPLAVPPLAPPAPGYINLMHDEESDMTVPDLFNVLSEYSTSARNDIDIKEDIQQEAKQNFDETKDNIVVANQNEEDQGQEIPEDMFEVNRNDFDVESEEVAQFDWGPTPPPPPRRTVPVRRGISVMRLYPYVEIPPQIVQPIDNPPVVVPPIKFINDGRRNEFERLRDQMRESWKRGQNDDVEKIRKKMERITKESNYNYYGLYRKGVDDAPFDPEALKILKNIEDGNEELSFRMYDTYLRYRRRRGFPNFIFDKLFNEKKIGVAETLLKKEYMFLLKYFGTLLEKKAPVEDWFKQNLLTTILARDTWGNRHTFDIKTDTKKLYFLLKKLNSISTVNPQSEQFIDNIINQYIPKGKVLTEEEKLQYDRAKKSLKGNHILFKNMVEEIIDFAKGGLITPSFKDLEEHWQDVLNEEYVELMRYTGRKPNIMEMIYDINLLRAAGDMLPDYSIRYDKKQISSVTNDPGIWRNIVEFLHGLYYSPLNKSKTKFKKTSIEYWYQNLLNGDAYIICKKNTMEVFNMKDIDYKETKKDDDDEDEEDDNDFFGDEEDDMDEPTKPDFIKSPPKPPPPPPPPPPATPATTKKYVSDILSPDVQPLPTPDTQKQKIDIPLPDPTPSPDKFDEPKYPLTDTPASPKPQKTGILGWFSSFIPKAKAKTPTPPPKAKTPTPPPKAKTPPTKDTPPIPLTSGSEKSEIVGTSPDMNKYYQEAVEFKSPLPGVVPRKPYSPFTAGVTAVAPTTAIWLSPDKGQYTAIEAKAPGDNKKKIFKKVEVGPVRKGVTATKEYNYRELPAARYGAIGAKVYRFYTTPAVRTLPAKHYAKEYKFTETPPKPKVEYVPGRNIEVIPEDAEIINNAEEIIQENQPSDNLLSPGVHLVPPPVPLSTPSSIAPSTPTPVYGTPLQTPLQTPLKEEIKEQYTEEEEEQYEEEKEVIKEKEYEPEFPDEEELAQVAENEYNDVYKKVGKDSREMFTKSDLYKWAFEINMGEENDPELTPDEAKYEIIQQTGVPEFLQNMMEYFTMIEKLNKEKIQFETFRKADKEKIRLINTYMNTAKLHYNFYKKEYFILDWRLLYLCEKNGLNDYYPAPSELITKEINYMQNTIDKFFKQYKQHYDLIGRNLITHIKSMNQIAVSKFREKSLDAEEINKNIAILLTLQRQKNMIYRYLVKTKDHIKRFVIYQYGDKPDIDEILKKAEKAFEVKEYKDPDKDLIPKYKDALNKTVSPRRLIRFKGKVNIEKIFNAELPDLPPKVYTEEQKQRMKKREEILAARKAKREQEDSDAEIEIAMKKPSVRKIKKKTRLSSKPKPTPKKKPKSIGKRILR